MTSPLTQLQPQLEATLRRVAARVAPAWPLETLVAANPYHGWTEHPFARAAERLGQLAAAPLLPERAWLLEAAAQAGVTSADLREAARRAGLDPRSTPLDLDALRAAPRAELRRAPTVAALASEAGALDVDAFLLERFCAWAASYFDAGQATWRLAAPEGPYESWRFEASRDRTYDLHGLGELRRGLGQLPERPLDAATRALAALALPASCWEDYLSALALRAIGWASHAAWRGWERALRGDPDDDTLLELLCVHLASEAVLLQRVLGPEGLPRWQAAWSRHTASPPPELTPERVLLGALELRAQRRLAATLAEELAPAAREPRAEARPRAQLVFCIDVRSEVFRRALESRAPDLETLGFAGFFGLPLARQALGSSTPAAHCPGLLAPAHTLGERAESPDATAALLARQAERRATRSAWEAFRAGAGSCFGYVSPLGLGYLPRLVGAALGWWPPARGGEPTDLRARERAALEPDLSELPLERRVALVAGALRGMSLTSGFAPLVVLAGHGASTVNNLHASALECGACGARSGAFSARVAARLCNDAAVRSGLRAEGIEIPAETWFVAALHDTTLDQVGLLEPQALPDSHREAWAALEADLLAAGATARAERAVRLGLPAERGAELARRARDWGQVRPEWGLTGCQALVIAPRRVTRGRDLGGRVFLHSYEASQDPEGQILEALLSAPAVVATWISYQYYAAAVDPLRFGAGDKTLHNLVGRVGVLEGSGGDLRIGLPRQSVHDGLRWRHEPLRLSVYVEAPLERLAAALERQPAVRQLVAGQWIALFALQSGRVAARWSPSGWEACDSSSGLALPLALAGAAG